MHDKKRFHNVIAVFSILAICSCPLARAGENAFLRVLNGHELIEVNAFQVPKPFRDDHFEGCCSFFLKIIIQN